MNNMQIFQNPEFGNVRTTEDNGKILFCGKDVAAALGYKKTRNAIMMHCKGAQKLGTLTKGGVQEMVFIDESDVYRLTVHSRLPNAEKFERWLFNDVLPAIRKNGGYGDISGIVKECVREVLAQIMPVITGTVQKPDSPSERLLDAAMVQRTKRTRQSYKVACLPDGIYAKAVEMRFRDGLGYDELSSWLKDRGYEISRSSIFRYFSDMRVTDVFSDRIEMLSCSNEIITVFSNGNVVRRICR